MTEAVSDAVGFALGFVDIEELFVCCWIAVAGRRHGIMPAEALLYATCALRPSLVPYDRVNFFGARWQEVSRNHS